MGRVRLGVLDTISGDSAGLPRSPPVSPGLRRMSSKNRDLIDRLQTSASWTTPVSISYICLVSTADICPVSAADICPVPTADICPVSTEDIYYPDGSGQPVGFIWAEFQGKWLVSAAVICRASTADICPVSTEDIYPVSTEDETAGGLRPAVVMSSVETG